jgi:hypothetical protein
MCLCSEIVSTLAIGNKSVKGGVIHVNTNIENSGNGLSSWCMNNARDPADLNQLTSAASGIWRGSRHFDNMVTYSLFNTVFPPNFGSRMFQFQRFPCKIL